MSVKNVAFKAVMLTAGLFIAIRAAKQLMTEIKTTNKAA
jgi:hypothetical protein